MSWVKYLLWIVHIKKKSAVILIYMYIYIDIDLLEDKERRCTEQQRDKISYVYKWEDSK